MAFPLEKLHPRQVRPLAGRNHAEPGGLSAAGLRLRNGALPGAAGGGHVLRGDVPWKEGKWWMSTQDGIPMGAGIFYHFRANIW